MISKELERIASITDEAIEEVREGNYAAAKRLLREIEDSFCTTEADRGSSIVRAFILLKRNKIALAKELIITNNFAAWGSPELLSLLRQCRRPTNKDTKRYSLTILGGLATFGAFTQFTEEHVCTVEVLAESKEKAIKYASELARFQSPGDMTVLSCVEAAFDGKKFHEGVLRTEPFRLNGSQSVDCRA